MTRLLVGFGTVAFLLPTVYASLPAVPDSPHYSQALLIAAFTGFGALIGVPFFLLFHRRNWLKAWQVAFGGGAVGLVCSLLFLCVGGGEAGPLMAVYAAPWFFTVGVFHALLFWLIAIWRNHGLTSDVGRVSGA